MNQRAAHVGLHGRNNLSNPGWLCWCSFLACFGDLLAGHARSFSLCLSGRRFLRKGPESNLQCPHKGMGTFDWLILWRAFCLKAQFPFKFGSSGHEPAQPFREALHFRRPPRIWKKDSPRWYCGWLRNPEIGPRNETMVETSTCWYQGNHHSRVSEWCDFWISQPSTVSRNRLLSATSPSLSCFFAMGAAPAG